ncbi:MAG TPA: class I SAM-dependent methyltransferase [Candidatus Acidoferrales bacterium]|nr:class I SAM-dependent methyltransferase [Candidatus Acidoferrales bacterium]
MAKSNLFDSRVQRVLDRLHGEARADKWKFAWRMPMLAWAALRKRTGDPAFEHAFFHDVYIPVSREQGAMLYLLARGTGARRVVEFGSSFGISTIYLAAAVRDNGGGEVIGSELEPAKHARATENIEEAGLSAYARVLPGDAQATFRNIEAPIDLLLLDGWKGLYLPILQLLAPKLRPGAFVLADNIFTFRKSLRPFVEYVQSGRNGFVSTTLHVSDGFELSVRVQG